MTFEEYWDQTRRNRRPDEPIDRVDCKEAWNAAVEECARYMEEEFIYEGRHEIVEELRELKAES